MRGRALLRLVKDLVPHIRPSGTEGWQSLPECPSCNKDRHFYFHPEIGYRCFHCGVSGPIEVKMGQRRRSFAAVMSDGGFVIPDDPETIPVPGLDEFFAELPPPPGPTTVVVPFPAGTFPFTPEELPEAFMFERGYSGSFILQLGLHYCTTPPYGGRIIIPLETEDDRSWIAYLRSKQFARPGIKKALNPPAKIGGFLYLYNRALEYRPRRLVICEGTTDAMRILHHLQLDPDAGYPLALLGKKLSPKQLARVAHLAAKSGTAQVVVALDADVESGKKPDNLVTAEALASKLGRDRVRLLDFKKIGKQLPALAAAIIDERKRHPYARSNMHWGEIDPDDIRQTDHWVSLLKEADPMTEVL